MLEIYPTETTSKPLDIFIKNNYKGDLIGVEIGIGEGTHAKNLLTILSNLKLLYLIDPYIPYQDGRIFRDLGVVRSSLNEFRRNILNTELKDRIIFIRETSENAVKKIPDNLDFIYIDGNHSYEYVKRDLELYYPKIKIDGIMGGDDYNYPRHIGVTQAINEFVKKYELELNTESYKLSTTKQDPRGYVDNNDWWIIKKKNE